MSESRLMDQRKHWWKIFIIISAISVSIVGYIGYKTYKYAPPMCDFVDEESRLVFSAEDIIGGQDVFFRYGLMDYGSFLGDGGLRGPDFTGEALNRTAQWMNEFHDKRWKERVPDYETRKAVVQALVQKEIKNNRYDADYYAKSGNTEESKYGPGAVTLTAAQVHAFHLFVEYNTQKFEEGGELVGVEQFKPTNYITDKEKIRQLTAFFFWGGWICGAQRPGYLYSYTHNWPYDPLAGNLPHGGLVLWSVIGVLAVVLSVGIMFYYYGKDDQVTEMKKGKLSPLATTDIVDKYRPTRAQLATYKFFAVAAILFMIQVLAGLLTIIDFMGIFANMGIEINHLLPVTITRAWHSQMSVLWIAVCWFAATIWVLPLISRPEPSGQLTCINTFFWMLIFVTVGGILGIPLGIKGIFGEGAGWRWFGLQGWEFLTIGRLYHIVLFVSFIVWFIIVMRGLWPVLRLKQTWSLPNWLVYSIAGIIFMFTASFVARPDTNFVIADFWRWCTIHMWVEAFFEVLTTIIIAYFMYLMGFVSHRMAAKTVYLASILFLGSGLIGIAHNFYWNAKSIETIALGGVLSSLQVAPLILLTVSAWRFRKIPESSFYQLQKKEGSQAAFGLSTPFLFLIGVNFWNFFGAGVFGLAINLPIVNYYQHGTYLTVNHAHAALFGVYGNLAIATMLFCGRWNIGPDRWNAKLLHTSFWSMNVGLMLMVAMDLFPVGVHQLVVAMTDGYAYARSQAFLETSTFQMFTWFRSLGVLVFVVGGVFPLVWFMVSRWVNLKRAETKEEQLVKPGSVLAMLEG